MIIVWINKRNWKKPGAILNVSVNNALSFAQLGFETHLCVGAGMPSDTENDLRDFYGVAPVPYLKVHRVPHRRIGSSLSSTPVYLHAYRLVRALSARDQVVVFTRDPGFLPLLARLCRRARAKGFYEPHDFFADLSWRPERRPAYYRDACYERLFLPRISGLVCITRHQQALYAKLFPRLPSCASSLGTHVRPSGTSAEERRKRRTIAYLGTIHSEKGTDLLLETSSTLGESGIRVLLLGGKSEHAAVFRNKAEQLKLGESVRWLPCQPPEKMHRILAEQVSAGTLMLKDTFYNRYLTCPAKALDYLSFGIPSVASDLPSVREVLGDAGVYVAPDDPHGYMQAVRELLDNPRRYEEMSDLTRERAGQMTWQRRAREILAFISPMLN